MATVFHSLTQAGILRLLNSQGLVANDLYYAQDIQKLYVCCTNTDNSVGIAETGMILTGAITLGFNGNATSLGGAAIVGTPTEGQTLVFDGTNWVPQTAASSSPNIVNVTGNYSTQITDDVLLVNLASPATITLTTDRLVAGKIYTVTLVVGSAQASVVGEHGETIEGDAEGALLFEGDSVDLFWTGSNFVVQ
jgi:hypothetical protein